MPSINQFQTLNRYADNMITSVVNNAPGKNTYIRNFLREANMNKTQGNALVAYYSRYNRQLENATNEKGASDLTTRRLEKLPELIEQSINDIPALKQEADVFISELAKNYPTTLARRVSVAAQGGVAADKIKPKSRLNKLMVLLNEFVYDIKNNLRD